MFASFISIKMPTFLRSRAAAVRRIQGAYRKFRARKMMAAYARKRRYVRRAVGLGNPSPTFVETYSKSQIVIPAAPGGPNINITGGVGGVFSARISEIPQIAQYAQLYKQYRINWVKVILVPNYNSTSADMNSAQYNAAVPTGIGGQGRIVYAINDSPQLTVPANETEVLTDNGCKIKALGSKWSCSFKPVPDVGVTSGTTANPIYTRQKFRQWFNFDLVTTGNNPLHYGVTYWMSQPNNGMDVVYNVYFKVSFSLRDPQ